MTCARCDRPLTGRQAKWCSENCRKRAWDDSHLSTCVDCGTTIGGRSTRCWECDLRERDKRRVERWTRIATLWAEGLTMREMVERGCGRATISALGVEMDRMKKAGWDLPIRRAGWTGNYRRGGPPRVEPLTRAQARQRLGYAVHAGRVKRPERCERCNKRTHVNGHHHDYSKPLDVEWLCRSCHVAHHVAERAAA